MKFLLNVAALLALAVGPASGARGHDARKTDNKHTSIMRGLKGKSGGSGKSGKSGSDGEFDVCHGDGARIDHYAYAEADDDNDDTDTVTSYVEFGSITVSDDNENILVDVTIESLTYTQAINRDDDYSIDSTMEGEIVAYVYLYPGCTSAPCSGSAETSVSASGGLTMHEVDRQVSFHPDDDDYMDALFLLEYEQVNTGRFLFEGLSEGEYLVVVEFDLEAYVFAGPYENTQTAVEIGEHVVVVHRDVASRGYCAPELARRNLKFY